MEQSLALIQRGRLGAFAVAAMIVAVVASLTVFWKLGVKPLENWDEGIHAEVTREMVQDGHWISLSYRDAYYTAKPPLKFWLTAPLFVWFGPTEMSARLWSALAGVATALVLALWAYEHSRSIRFGILVPAIFLAGRFVMYHSFRTGETDGLLVFFVTAALYAYWKSRQTAGWFIAFGALVGLAIMTKSAAGLLPVAIAGIDLTLDRGWSRIGRKRLIWAIGAALIVVLPWHLIETLRHGAAFWRGYVGFNILERSGEVLYANNVGWSWYATIIMNRWIPFGTFIAAAIILAIRRVWKQRDPLDRLLLIWTVVVFVAFSLVKTKFDWYILPIYPALAFLIGRMMTEFLHMEKRDRLLVIVALASFAWFVFRIPQDFVHAGALWRATPFAYLPEWFSDSTAGRLIVAAVSSAGVVVVMRLLHHRIRIASTRAVGMVLVVYLWALAFGWQVSYLRHLPTSSDYTRLAEAVIKQSERQVDVVGVSLETRPALNFYLRRIEGLAVREVLMPEAATAPLVLTTPALQQTSFSGSSDGILEIGDYVLLRQR